MLYIHFYNMLTHIICFLEKTVYNSRKIPDNFLRPLKKSRIGAKRVQKEQPNTRSRPHVVVCCSVYTFLTEVKVLIL